MKFVINNLTGPGYIPLQPINESTGEPLISWRLMNYCLYQGSPESRFFDKQIAWDALEYKKIYNLGSGYQLFSDGESNYTRIYAIKGPGTIFDKYSTDKFIPQEELHSLARDYETEDTIIVVEVRNSEVHWMQPGDFDIRTMPRTINDPSGKGISSKFEGGFHVGFVDGEVWFLSNDTPFENLEKLFTIESARFNERDTLLGPYRIR